MKILVDAFFLDQSNTSIGTFQFAIVQSLLDLGGDAEFLILTTPGDKAGLRTHSGVTFATTRRVDIASRLRFTSRHLSKWRPDVYFASYNIAARVDAATRTLLQHHDFAHGLRDRSFPQLVGGQIYRRLHVASARRADLSLANSQFTAEQAAAVAPEVPVRVVYHDCHPDFKSEHIPDSRTIGALGPLGLTPGHYVLCPGRIHPKYKNLRALLEAFKLYSNQVREDNLCIVSSDHMRRSDSHYLRRQKFRVVQLDSVSRPNLVALYRGARMVVYPSLYEGFAVPVLEAQHSDVPLIVSNSRPMPEIAGDGALYFRDVSDLVEKMLDIASSDSTRDRLVRAGRHNCLRFSWSTTALQTMTAIRSIAAPVAH